MTRSAAAAIHTIRQGTPAQRFRVSRGPAPSPHATDYRRAVLRRQMRRRFIDQPRSPRPRWPGLLLLVFGGIGLPPLVVWLQLQSGDNAILHQSHGPQLFWALLAGLPPIVAGILWLPGRRWRRKRSRRGPDPRST